jgi:hypothetical protein
MPYGWGGEMPHRNDQQSGSKYRAQTSFGQLEKACIFNGRSLVETVFSARFQAGIRIRRNPMWILFPRAACQFHGRVADSRQLQS